MRLLDNYGEVKTDEELQKNQKKYDNLHPLYVKYSCIYNKGCHNELREKIEVIYNNVKNYLDKDFKLKFQKNFNERLWEIFFINLLLEKGYSIIEKEDKGPDIQIKLEDGRNLWIEIVLSNRGCDQNYVEEIPLGFSGGHIDDFDLPRILRITNSVYYKYNKYFNPDFKNEKGKSLYVDCKGIDENDLYFIAISPDFEIFDERIILGSLYAIGKQVYKQGGNGNLIGPYYEEVRIIRNSNGSDINCDIFLNDSHKRLNGVFFFGNRAIDVLGNEVNDLLDNMVISFNKNTTNNISRSFFNFGKHIFIDGNGEILMKKN